MALGAQKDCWLIFPSFKEKKLERSISRLSFKISKIWKHFTWLFFFEEQLLFHTIFSYLASFMVRLSIKNLKMAGKPEKTQKWLCHATSWSNLPEICCVYVSDGQKTILKFSERLDKNRRSNNRKTAKVEEIVPDKKKFSGLSSNSPWLTLIPQGIYPENFRGGYGPGARKMN